MPQENEQVPFGIPSDEEQAALAAQMTSARKFLGRDLLGEAQKDTRIGNPLLRILAGMGEGAAAAKDPKYKTARQRRYDELLSEYTRQAPVLQRDLSQWEGVQARTASEKARLQQKKEQDANLLNSKKAERELKYRMFTEGDRKKLEAQAELMASQRGLTDAKAKAELADLIFEQANGARMGTMSGAGADAVAAGKNPAVEASIKKAAEDRAKLKMTQDYFKSIISPPKGAGGTGSTTIREAPFRKKDGTDVVETYKTTRVPGGGGAASPQFKLNDPSQIGSALDALLKGMGGAGGPAPTSPLTPGFNPQSSQPRIGFPASGQDLGASAPSPLQQRLAPQEGAKPLPLKGFDEQGRRVIDDTDAPPPDAAVKRDSMTREIKAAGMAALDRLSTKGIRENLDSVMGSNWYGLGGGDRLRTAWRSSNKEDSPINQAESDIKKAVVTKQWLDTVRITGAAMNETELQFANNLNPKLSPDQSSIVDQPWEVVRKLIGQQLFLSAAQYKNMIYAQTKGSDAAKQAAADAAGDFTRAIMSRTDMLANKWKQGDRLTPNDFTIEAIAPTLVDDAATQMFQQLKSRREAKRRVSK